MNSPKSDSTTSKPSFSRASLRWISSAVMALDFTTHLAFASLMMPRMVSRASGPVGHQCTFVPRASIFEANSVR